MFDNELIDRDGQLCQDVANTLFEEITSTQFLKREQESLNAYISNIENIQQQRREQNSKVLNELSVLRDEVSTQQIKIEGTKSQLEQFEEILAQNDDKNDVLNNDSIEENQAVEMAKRKLSELRSNITELGQETTRITQSFRDVFGIELVNSEDDKLYIVLNKVLPNDHEATLTVTCTKNPRSTMLTVRSISPELCGAEELIDAVNKHQLHFATFLATCREVFKRQYAA